MNSTASTVDLTPPRHPTAPTISTLGVLHHKRLGHGRQLTLNVESQPPPTPMTTTLFWSCQSQLAKVQQQRTCFNVLAGKQPLSPWILKPHHSPYFSLVRVQRIQARIKFTACFPVTRAGHINGNVSGMYWRQLPLSYIPSTARMCNDPIDRKGSPLYRLNMYMMGRH
jgi:hypothetical protein